jgi:hypothetical protein
MMAFSRLMDWVRSKTGGDRARETLKANAEKALAMKRAAEPHAKIPPYQTAGEGMQPAADPHMSDATRGAEAGFTPQLKRSRVARSGDAS